jgi:ATP-binding cassette subfamily B (MDR/TAP) protein 1
LTGILFVGVVPAMFCIITFGSKIVSKFAVRATDLNSKATSVADGAINAVPVVQAFDATDRLAEEQMGFMNKAVKEGIRKAIAGAGMLACVYFVAYAANALAFWQGSQQIAQGLFNQGEGAGTVYTVVFLILDASFVVGSFGPFLQTFALAAAAGQNILDLLDKPDPVISVYSDAGQKMPTPSENNEIKFNNVNFVYPARPDAPVMNGLNLIIPAGKVTAIVGSSGSGKSTTASLLMRFYDPTSGSITIGGQDLKSLNIRDYRRHIALVDQEPILFTGTLLDNIRHGLLHHLDGMTEEEITIRCHDAARKANAYDFIMALPDGFETKVGGGSSTQLSGGQKQRVTIARALAGEPELLILDEPTAALDMTSEGVVMDALEKAQQVKGRTTVVIAHRLSTVRQADKIVVMGAGKVIEEGNHDSLMAKQGAYFDLVKAQEMKPAAVPEIKSAGEKIEKILEEIAAEKKMDSESVFEDEGDEEAAVKKEQKYSSLALIRRCVGLSAPDLHLILLGLCASLLTGGLILGESVIFGNLVSILNTQKDAAQLTHDANFYSLLFFILASVALVAYAVSGSCFGIVSERLIRRIKDISFRTILHQDAQWFHEPGHGATALLAMLNMDAGHISGLSGVILGTICSVCTSMIGGIVLAHVVAWKIAIVLLAAVPVVLVSGFLRLRILAKMEQRHETAYLDAASLATEAVKAIRTVSALGREKDIARLYTAAIDKPYRESRKFIVTGNFWLAFALSITYFVYALAYYWGAKQVREGNNTPLQFFIVLPALLFSAQASGQMFSLAPEITRAKTAARSIFHLHDQVPKIDVSSTPKAVAVSEKSPAPSTPVAGGAAIELRNLNFSYPTRRAAVLSNLNLSIRAGEYIAFVGPSGAGKSSIISLLERFYDPVSGSILLDGADIRSLPVCSHRSRLALVPQEPCLFPGSIAFNISLGRDGATREDVERVCKTVGLDTFISSLPEGYDTDVGSNGNLLSGGQKQRIALARALVRDPQVLLLDEATSSLDSHSEQVVQEGIAQAARGRTTVVVAHRLSTVTGCDRIVVFDKGMVVEMGTHAELMERKGRYWEMAKGQMLV